MSTPPSVSLATSADDVEAFAADVAYYLSLTPRQLPSQYFYDALGSSLFQTICELPWYGITRAESRLLAARGGAILGRFPAVSTVVELGPGSGEKLRLLLASAQRALDVHLVDVSQSALETAARTVGALSGVRVATYRAHYDAGLRNATSSSIGQALVAFLGSNVGNFDPPGAEAVLHNIRTCLAHGDALLLGTDLVKAEATLLAAYDDPLGVTAAFNRNLLVRLNRELGANFDLDQYAHRAVWNGRHGRIEMHLVARSAQHVRIPRANITFSIESGESIWTESSYKYRPEDVTVLLESCGFDVREQWIDQGDPFALTLAEAS